MIETAPFNENTYQMLIPNQITKQISDEIMFFHKPSGIVTLDNRNYFDRIYIHGDDKGMSPYNLNYKA